MNKMYVDDEWSREDPGVKNTVMDGLEIKNVCFEVFPKYFTYHWNMANCDRSSYQTSLKKQICFIMKFDLCYCYDRAHYQTRLLSSGIFNNFMLIR